MALSEIVAMIEDVLSSSEKSPVILLKDVVQKYKDTLLQLGATEDFANSVHSTRLKKAILDRVDGLSEKKKGKDVLLTLEEHVGHAIFEASKISSFDEGIILCKSAKIIRQHLFESEETFNGDISKERQTGSVPKELVHLIGLILEDKPHHEASAGNCRSLAVKLSQTIRFNAVKTKRNSAEINVRHSTQNEPPLPTKIGLMIHSKTRKKSIVNELAADGLSVSYNRVLEIQDSIGRQLSEKYEREQIVCPHPLQKDHFTLGAIDNIDHVPSSSTATSSFHGTSISIFQQVEGQMTKQPFIIEKVEDTKAIRLPNFYTDIKPTKSGKPEPPNLPKVASSTSKLSCENFEWLQSIINSSNLQSATSPGDRMSFSAFHSQKIKEEPIAFKSLSTLLPVLTESVDSPAMIRHSMELVKGLTRHLNPSQKQVVITGDQPVYALGKQVQWMYPDRYDDILWMMGSLHIEMAFLHALGNWLSESGWTDVFERARITTTGRIDSFLSGNKVKRTRYAHQVSLASLVELSVMSFRKQNSGQNYAEWKASRREKSVNAEYWFTVIEMEALYFIFIKSLRMGDFETFLECLKALIPWFFALDHTHYSRWLSIFVQDLSSLEANHKETYDAFIKGFFTVRKTNRVFSNMGIDQAHEQNNKILKDDGGIIGILDNPTALLKWAICGPVICHMLENEEEENGNEGLFSSLHHEDNDAFEKKFQHDRDSFVSSFQDQGNPFEEEEKNLIHLTSRTVLDDNARKSVTEAWKTGSEQYKVFIEDRLVKKTSSFYDSIKRNNLSLFRQKHILNISKPRQKILSLNSERKLYANLYVACQSREGDLDNFFSHENHAFPIAISEYGKLRKATSKSDFLECLESLIEVTHDAPEVSMKVIDGAAFVNMNRPKSSSTFGIYCQDELVPKLIFHAKNVQRMDLVFDVYREISLKSQTRENRGEGIRISVRKNTPIYKDFTKFMRNDNNKTELFKMVSETAVSIPERVTTVVATVEDKVISNAGVDKSNIEPCNHEEADTRLLLHVLDGARSGIKKISILTVDTDVVVIALRHFFSLNIEELWIEFGVGKSRRFIPVHRYAAMMGNNWCKSLTFWHALTGCDTVSSFNGKGKKTAWKILRSFQDGLDTFSRYNYSISKNFYHCFTRLNQ